MVYAHSLGLCYGEEWAIWSPAEEAFGELSHGTLSLFGEVPARLSGSRQAICLQVQETVSYLLETLSLGCFSFTGVLRGAIIP